MLLSSWPVVSFCAFPIPLLLSRFPPSSFSHLIQAPCHFTPHAFDPRGRDPSTTRCLPAGSLYSVLLSPFLSRLSVRLPIGLLPSRYRRGLVDAHRRMAAIPDLHTVSSVSVPATCFSCCNVTIV
jgi:hypothetical protein